MNLLNYAPNFQQLMGWELGGGVTGPEAPEYSCLQVHRPPEELIHTAIPEWELRVEGRLLEQTINRDLFKPRRKFSSFFKTVVIEVDKDMYGPDNHLVEWRRSPHTTETDGFSVKRPLLGRTPVDCTLFFMFDYQPPQFKLSGPLSRVLGELYF